MNNTINIDYDAKSKKLVVVAPFHLNEVTREFPSRRFDPKSKAWKVPLLKANLKHLESVQHKYDFRITDGAKDAIRGAEAIMAAPRKVPFPRHLYDFKKAAVPFTPMGHQDRMLDHSFGLKSFAWFAKMGTGKTYTAIHLAFAQWKGGSIDKLAIICPSTLRTVWQKEFAKYATGEYDFRIHDSKAKWLTDFCRKVPTDRLQVLAISVEGLGVSEGLYDSVCGYYLGGRVMTICDESSRIKNPDAKRTKRAITLGSMSEIRGVLNGTPIALGIEDLWAQYEFLDPNIIGTGDYWAYKTRYLVMGGFENKEIIGYQHIEELMAMIEPYTLEVGKDVLDLPPKVKLVRNCVATAEQKELFRVILKGATRESDPLIKVENTLEKMLRLRQVVGGYLPRGKRVQKMVDGQLIEEIETTVEPLQSNPKAELLEEIISDNFIGSKFIIWTTFIHEIEDIRDKLATKYGAESVECYYGKTAMADRSRIEDRYCNDRSMRFFVGNPVAAGLGLTLISGENDVMVYYSGTNAYIDRAQSEDRAHRIGQKNSVTVLDLVMERTIDVSIVESIEKKMGVEEYLIAQIKAGVKLEDTMMG